MTFSLLLSLPAELRIRIWEAECPELTTQPQMLQVEFDLKHDEVRPGDNLWRQTASVRRILSICADSRSHALRALPNTISLNKGKALVRYRATRDLIRLDPDFANGGHGIEWRSVTGFSEQVVNLALNLAFLPWVTMSAAQYFRLYLLFPNLRYIFVTTWGLVKRPKDLAWTTSPNTRRTELAVLEEFQEGRKDLVMTYTWPDLPRHEAWAGAAIPVREMALSYHGMSANGHGMRGDVVMGQRALTAILDYTRDTLEGMELAGTVFTEEELAHLRGIWMWPLVSLPESILQRLERDIRESGVEALPATFREI